MMANDQPHSLLERNGPAGTRRPELDRMKAAQWPTLGRTDRVIRARAAFDVRPPPWHLAPVNIRCIAEDADLEYE